jgi:hypothetical protein
LIISCAKNTQVHPPVGGVLTEKDLETSKNRTKNLNLMERSQIKDWINHQNEKFYSTGLNYWINMDDFEQREKKMVILFLISMICTILIKKNYMISLQKI